MMDANPLTLMKENGFPCGAWIALDQKTFEQSTTLLQKVGRFVTGAKLHFSTENNLKEKQQQVRKAGAKKTWWDRKAHDTGATVRGIIRTAIDCGFDRVTIHIGNDYEVMYAALDEAQGRIEIIGITVLTSITPAEAGIQFGMPLESAVLLRARMAAHANIHGVVCSPQEVELLHSRRKFSKVAGQCLELANLRLVIPGTRTISFGGGGQHRVATAPDTFEAADFTDIDFVFGSEVYGSANEVATLAEICFLLHQRQQAAQAQC